MFSAKEIYKLSNPIEMKIEKTYPPIYEELIKVLPDGKKPGVLFCYGTTIHNPTDIKLTPWIYEHEKVHSYYQSIIGVEQWWEQYLGDKSFRFDEELAAHKVEYYIFKKCIMSDNKRKEYLFDISKRLASPLYSAGITQADCRKAILS